MSALVLLDTGPLGMVTHPKTATNGPAARWVEQLLAAGVRLLVPEIADYELRRELLRANLSQSIARLDALESELGFDPIQTETMRQAAAFWARARNIGQPTADDKALDGDMILAAHSAVLTQRGFTVTIATTNVGHLSRFARASLWNDLTPAKAQAP